MNTIGFLLQSLIKLRDKDNAIPREIKVWWGHVIGLALVQLTMRRTGCRGGSALVSHAAVNRPMQGYSLITADLFKDNTADQLNTNTSITLPGETK